MTVFVISMIRLEITINPMLTATRTLPSGVVSSHCSGRSILTFRTSYLARAGVFCQPVDSLYGLEMKIERIIR